VTDWSPERGAHTDDHEDRSYSFVPIDPCQPVIAALRIALQERMARAFIDLEVDRYEPLVALLPDPYAVKQIAADKFAAAVLPTIPDADRAVAAARAVVARRLQLGSTTSRSCACAR
jgi:hypothetical protein